MHENTWGRVFLLTWYSVDLTDLMGLYAGEGELIFGC